MKQLMVFLTLFTLTCCGGADLPEWASHRVFAEHQLTSEECVDQSSPCLFSARCEEGSAVVAASCTCIALQPSGREMYLPLYSSGVDEDANSAICVCYGFAEGMTRIYKATATCLTE